MNMMKVKTWGRIQRRVAAIYLVDILDVIEWPLRFAINWLIFVSIPLWLWIPFVYGVLWRAIAFSKSAERGVLTGRTWFWQMFKIY